MALCTVQHTEPVTGTALYHPFLYEIILPNLQCLTLCAFSEVCASEIGGFSDDYSFLVRALLDLYATTHSVDWLQWAWQLQQRQDDLFWDDSEDSGGYFMTSGADPSVLLRMKEGEQLLVNNSWYM